MAIVEHEQLERGDEIEPPNAKETLLVLDDDPLVLRVSCRVVERLGYNVVPAQSGRQAIHWLEEHDADLVILDLMMPELNGVETYREILRFKPDQKAMVYSGYAEPYLIHEATELGAEPILIKPAKHNELAAALIEKLAPPVDGDTDGAV